VPPIEPTICGDATLCICNDLAPKTGVVDREENDGEARLLTSANRQERFVAAPHQTCHLEGLFRGPFRLGFRLDCTERGFLCFGNALGAGLLLEFCSFPVAKMAGTPSPPVGSRRLAQHDGLVRRADRRRACRSGAGVKSGRRPGSAATRSLRSKRAWREPTF
jgi:hypothetical protein